MSRRIAVALIALLALGGGYAWLRARKQFPEGSGEAGTSARARATVLTAKPADAGVEMPSTTNGVWAAVADIGAPDGPVTVVAFSTGAGSMFWGVKGGIAAGQAHDGVRQAAQQAVAAMENCAAQLKATGLHPPPQPGNIRLYAHSRAGLVSSEELAVNMVATPTHPLGPCVFALNDVMTELKQLSEGGTPAAPASP